ncbi:phytoene desaturase family protein [Gorillibacterium massiliense]|uniref:phytoene desaturase family protein n=1 Tax=Gorillibacterium massiliense TaxID=1280390 RepID=UPI0004ACE5C6|nr:NAD(P)/FAD-dependent oxidoreductase [Gorillibacterium massiliense]
MSKTTDQTYDYIIIGSGLSGLVAGALASQNGKKVIILEKHFLYGGFATSFFRGKWEFDVSLHCLSGLNEGGATDSILKDLGLRTKLEFFEAKTLYRAVFPGFSFSVKSDCGDYLQSLCDIFPDDREGLCEFFEMVKQIREDSKDTHRAKTMLFRYREVTLQDAFDQLRLPQKCQALLAAYCNIYMGLDPDEALLINFAFVWTDYHLYGGYYPAGKSKSISDALRAMIVENGGQVETNSEVRTILVDHQRAYGVQTKKGHIFYARHVISGICPKNALEMVQNAESLPMRFRNKVENIKPSVSALQAYLILNVNFALEYGEECHEIFLYEDEETNLTKSRMAKGEYDKLPLCITAYENIVPGYNRDDQITTLTVMQLCHFEDWDDLSESEYRAKKETILNLYLDRLEKRYPGIRSKVAFCELATPKTVQRYTGHAKGAIYGAAQMKEQSLHLSLSQSTPVDGLFFTGAWTRSGSGYGGAMLSGYSLMKQLLSAESMI